MEKVFEIIQSNYGWRIILLVDPALDLSTVSEMYYKANRIQLDGIKNRNIILRKRF